MGTTHDKMGVWQKITLCLICLICFSVAPPIRNVEGSVLLSALHGVANHSALFPGEEVTFTASQSYESGGCGGNLEIVPVGSSNPALSFPAYFPPLLYRFFLTNNGQSIQQGGTPIPPGNYVFSIIGNNGNVCSNVQSFTIASPNPFIGSVDAIPGGGISITGSGLGNAQGTGYVTLSATPSFVQINSPGLTSPAPVIINQVQFWGDLSVVFHAPANIVPGVPYNVSVTTAWGETTPKFPIVIPALLPPPRSAPLQLVSYDPNGNPTVIPSPAGQPPVISFSFGLTGPTLIHKSDSENVSIGETLPANFQFDTPAGNPDMVVNDMNTIFPVWVEFTDDSDKIGYVIGYYPGDRGSRIIDDPKSAGNKGHYQVMIEEFVDCVPGSKASFDAQKKILSNPPQNMNSHCMINLGNLDLNNLGPDGRLGFWQTIGQSSPTDLFGPEATTSDGANQNNQAAKGNSVEKYLPIPVTLLYASNINYVRLEIYGYEGDTRMMPGAGNFATGIAWNPGAIFGTKQNCVNQRTPGGWRKICSWPMIGFHQYSASFDYDVKSQPFAIQVTPVGSVQMNILYSILYQPPGDQSTASYSTAVTEGTSYTVGENPSAANSSTSTQGTCSSTTWGLQVSVSHYVGTSGSASTTNTNCLGSSATNGSSQSQSDIAAITTSSQSGNTFCVPHEADSKGKCIPISTSLGKENYYNEPFWYDLFVLDLGQPFAVYSSNGNPVYRILPLTGWPALVEVPLARLAGCATGMSISLPGTNQTWSSQAICTIGGPSSPGAQPISLDPGEALSFIYQDPFYPNGQSTDPTATNRAAKLDYSCPDIADCPSMNGGITSVSINSATNVISTQTLLSNFQTSTNTSGFQLSGSGYNETDTSGSNDTGTTTTSYSTSTALTLADTFTYQVNLFGKDPDPSNPIYINFYQDDVFGTIMFQDTQAALQPKFPLPRPHLKNTALTASELANLHKVFLKVMETNPALRDKINKQLEAFKITKKCCGIFHPSSSKHFVPTIKKNLLIPWRSKESKSASHTSGYLFNPSYGRP